MEFNQLFTLGLVAGITVGAPWGASGSYCFYQSLKSGWIVGAYTALGSVLAIFVFSFVGAFLLEFIAPTIQKPQIIEIIRLLIGCILILIGVVVLYSNSKTNQNSQDDKLDKNDSSSGFIKALSLGIISGKNIIGFPVFLIAALPRIKKLV